MNNKISFPGLGIKEFEIDPVAVEFGDKFSIAWYGVIITTGMVLAILYIYYRLKKQGLIGDDLIDITFSTVIPGILGARIYYVIFHGIKNPGTYKSFYDVIAIWEGGLAIYGGIIFGALGAMIMLKIKKIRGLAFFDALGPAVMIGQILGRWGNFFNCEAYGGETTLPWRMRINFAYGETVEVHPTFLYESLWNIVGLVIITLVFYTFKKRKFDGQVLLFYLSWYGLGRFMIEGLRQDSLYIGSIRVSQLVAIICFAVAGSLLVYFTIKIKGNISSDVIYKEESPKYAKIMAERNEPVQSENTENEETENEVSENDDGTKEE